MRRRQAFTLIELMVVIAIIAALAALLVPTVAGILERARFTKCGANFKTLATELVTYDKDLTGQPFAGIFPTLVRTTDLTNLPNSAYWDNAPSDGSEDPISATDTWDDPGRAALMLNGGCAMQQVWPLVVGGFVGETAFKCPGDNGWQQRTCNLKYGWTRFTEFSYGIQWPLVGTLNVGTGKIGIKNMAPPFGKQRDTRLVVLADRNPGGAVSGGRQHSNHPDQGAMGCDAGGNVMICDRPSDSKGGISNNDIYIDNTKAAGQGDKFIPTGVDDTLIMPIRSR